MQNWPTYPWRQIGVSYLFFFIFNSHGHGRSMKQYWIHRHEVQASSIFGDISSHKYEQNHLVHFGTELVVFIYSTQKFVKSIRQVMPWGCYDVCVACSRRDKAIFSRYPSFSILAAPTRCACTRPAGQRRLTSRGTPQAAGGDGKLGLISI